MRTAILLSVVVLLLTFSVASAAEPTPGAMKTVTCKANPSQSYSCYVPKAYTPKKTWPILYCFSPNANGDAFVQRYMKVCEERGWIVVGSMNSKNGPWGPIKTAIDAMWTDCEERFSLSKTMRYASGFSGGARVSFGLSDLKPKHIAGVIAIGAGLSSTAQGAVPRKELAIFIVCGETDFNRKEIEALVPRLKENGNPLHHELFPGAHTMPPVPVMEKAVRWMDDQAVERKAERFRKAIDDATALRDGGEPVKAWAALVEAMAANPGQKALQKEAAKLRKALERTDEVKPEAKALRLLDTAMKWVVKNRARIDKSKSVKAQAVKKLRRIVDGHGGTHAAKRAEAELAKLEE